MFPTQNFGTICFDFIKYYNQIQHISVRDKE